MKPETQQILYKIDRIALRVLYFTVAAMFVLAALWFIASIASRYAWMFLGSIAGICIVGRICLSPFVKSEEEEEMEEKVAYILAKQKSESAEAGAYNPLRNMTPEQEEKVIQVLHDLPTNQSNPSAINMATMAQYLTALDQMDKIDLTDLSRLRYWIADLTGKEVPASGHFNHAIPSTYDKKIAIAKEKLARILS